MLYKKLYEGNNFVGPFQRIKDSISPRLKVPRNERNPLTIKFAKHAACPDCGCYQFYKGPEGGLCHNTKCAHCGSEFNLAVIGGRVLHFERIGIEI